MEGHSKFLQWARELYIENCIEREGYKLAPFDFDEYIFVNIDFLIMEFNEFIVMGIVHE